MAEKGAQTKLDWLMEGKMSTGSRQGRRRRSSSAAPVLLAVLMFVACSSLFHAIYEVPTTVDENHVLRVSLDNFRREGTQKQAALTRHSPYKQEIANMRNETRETASSKSKRANLSPLLQTKNTSPYEDDPILVDRIRERPIENPPPSNGTETFSACLLVMDDNHRLVEWLAYHYHVLPLRHLIIAVDPRSRTSPTSILNRWRRMGMVVDEWDDSNFLKPEIARNVVPDDAELQVKRDRHRIRQKNFYQKCLKTMKEAGRTWVTLIDTDEFLTYNHKGGDAFKKWEKKQQKLHRESRFFDKKRIRPSQTPPTTADAGALIHYIRQEAAAGKEFFMKSCISCPRLQFGAKESSEEERQHSVPFSVNSDRLDTIRFRKHAERQDFVKNGLSKSIMDVSRIETFPRIQSLHRPIKTICSAPWKDDWNSGLRINHYLGSWEAYSFRDDSRRGGERSFEGWAFKAQDAEETDDNIRPWVGGFVAEHGAEKANELMHGAGLKRGYKDNLGKNWTIMFLDEILGANVTKGNDNRVAFDNFVRDFHFNKNQSTEGLL